MQQTISTTGCKKLDSYSILICSKYFNTKQDYINLICVNSKFKETTEKLRFNPIPIDSLKLFPNIQTQHHYSKKERRLPGIMIWEIWYKVNYQQFLKKTKNRIKCHHIMYTKNDKEIYGNEIPCDCSIVANSLFDFSKLCSITIPNNITSLGDYCFNNCCYLKIISLPNKLLYIGNSCFYGCAKLKSIELPQSVRSLGNECFVNCKNLTSINIPDFVTSIGYHCFDNCSSLKNLILPTTMNKLDIKTISNCSGLSIILKSDSTSNMKINYSN
ncbi:Leucine rich repeat protein bspa family [Entamoeba marina]